jgi:hypothetical protein
MIPASTPTRGVHTTRGVAFILEPNARDWKWLAKVIALVDDSFAIAMAEQPDQRLNITAPAVQYCD